MPRKSAAVSEWKPRQLSKVKGELVQKNAWLDPELVRKLEVFLASEGLTMRAWLEAKIWEDAGDIEVIRRKRPAWRVGMKEGR